jgi:predicted regulator of Ras-like GTPase activity (Roadblock/LC7/MglB family)
MAAIHNITERLRQFVADTEGVMGVVISTPEGLTYAYYSDRVFDHEMVSAIIASMYSLAKKSGRSADMGKPKEISVHLEEGSLYVFPLGELILGVETLPGVLTGMVLTNARRMLKDLEEITEEVMK